MKKSTPQHGQQAVARLLELPKYVEAQLYATNK
jgi:hypothetical protein